MRRAHDAIIDFPAGDDTEQAAWLAGTLRDLSREEPFERVLIEVAGTTNPARLVAAFRRRRDAISSGIELGDIICVIDALDFHRTAVAPQQGGEMSALLDFQLAQIKGATLLVLNKCDLVGEAERTTCLQRLTQLNPTARWLETAYGELPEEVWARSGAPKVPVSSPDHRGRNLRDPRPGPGWPIAFIGLFIPARLWDWFQAEHPGLWRVKGLVWLAHAQSLRRRNFAHATGRTVAARRASGGPRCRGRSGRPMPARWNGCGKPGASLTGDRRQELVLIGEAAWTHRRHACVGRLFAHGRGTGAAGQGMDHVAGPFSGLGRRRRCGLVNAREKMA